MADGGGSSGLPRRSTKVGTSRTPRRKTRALRTLVATREMASPHAIVLHKPKGPRPMEGGAARLDDIRSILHLVASPRRAALARAPHGGRGYNGRRRPVVGFVPNFAEFSTDASARPAPSH